MDTIRFTSKMDRPFRILFTIINLLIMALFASVIFVGKSTNSDILIVIVGSVVTIGLISWQLFDITYEFREDYLYIRAGFLFTKVRYNEMEGYRLVDNLLDVGSGFNLLSSTNAIAIMSPNILLGEVKVSPTNREAFIEELEKRRRAAHA